MDCPCVANGLISHIDAPLPRSQPKTLLELTTFPLKAPALPTVGGAELTRRSQDFGLHLLLLLFRRSERDVEK